jgi:cytoskeleton protein RodZ
VRQYAHLLGLDEEEMAAEVQRFLQPQMELPRFAEAGKPSSAPIQVPKVEEWEAVGDRGFSWSSPLPALALFVIAMLVCSGVYAWYQRTRHPAPAQNTAAAVPMPVPVQAAPPAQPPPTQQPEATPQAAEQQAAPPVQPTVVPTLSPLTASAAVQPPDVPVTPADAAPNPNATVHVRITAEEPSWVLVRSDGKYLFSGTLDANQSRTVEAVTNLELRLGNAGGVTVLFNGSPIGAVGPKGQVRTVQFTSGGFQIVAAPKSAPLPDPR